MKKEQLNQLKTLLFAADQTLSAASFNLNLMDRFIDGSTADAMKQSACKEADRQASTIKSGIGSILACRAIVEKLLADPEPDNVVSLWLLINENTDRHGDIFTDPFVWPLKELPKNGDKIAMEVIREYCPALPEQYYETDYYTLAYSFYEQEKNGTTLQLKLIAD